MPYILGKIGSYVIEWNPARPFDVTIRTNNPVELPNGVNAQLNKNGWTDQNGKKYPPGKLAKQAFQAEVDRVHGLVVDAVIHYSTGAYAELVKLSGHKDALGRPLKYNAPLAGWYAADLGHRQQGFRFLYKPSGMPVPPNEPRTPIGRYIMVDFRVADVHPPSDAR